MQNLWAPWRIDYILGKKDGACFLCTHPAAGRDEEHLILYKDGSILVVMNRYPYTNGHLLVAPRLHTSDFGALDPACANRLQHTMQFCVRTLTQLWRPNGFNLGVNLGEAAGAGIKEHLHWHVVPRWNGDNNFIPVLADTRVINQHLEETWQQLAGPFQKLGDELGPVQNHGGATC